MKLKARSPRMMRRFEFWIDVKTGWPMVGFLVTFRNTDYWYVFNLRKFRMV